MAKVSWAAQIIQIGARPGLGHQAPCPTHNGGDAPRRGRTSITQGTTDHEATPILAGIWTGGPVVEGWPDVGEITGRPVKRGGDGWAGGHVAGSRGRLRLEAIVPAPCRRAAQSGWRIQTFGSQ